MEREIPPILYKYFPPGNYLRQLLKGENMKFTSPLSFNDPFECEPLYCIEKGQLGTQFIKQQLQQMALSPANRLVIQQQLRNIQGKAISHDYMESESLRPLLEKIGICCFSGNRDNILMWSHYAQSHMGVSIGFDTSADFFKTAWKVFYSKNKPIVYRPSDSNDTLLNKSILTKSSDWQYENEWRVIKRTLSMAEVTSLKSKYNQSDVEEIDILTNQNGPGFYSFSKNQIVEVIVGTRASPIFKENIKTWIIESGVKPKMYQAIKHKFNFDLVIQKIN